MKNKKKKIIAIVLSAVIVVVGAITAIFAIPTRLNGGTETAKILLARERLDEKIFSKEIDFYKQVNNEIPSALKLPASADAGREVSLSVSDAEAPISYNKNKGDAIDNGEYVEWKNFPARSGMMLQIRNWFRDIELEAGRIADIIAKIKKGVGVTDKWIGFGGEECLLTVKDNAEVLIRRDLTYVGDYRVAKRYTRADAKNVYETFSYYNYTDGTTGEIRTVYIPNERYEFLYDNSNGFNDYIIAENSRGYWAVLRMNTIDGNSYSIDTTILKDGLGYNASINIDSNSAKPSAYWYEVYDVANSIDILRYAPYENRVETNVFFSALNGIKSVRTTPEQRDMIYTGRDGLEFHDVQPLIINTEKGELPLTKHKDVEYSSAHVSYNPQDWYYEGWITLQLYGNESYTPSDYIEKLFTYLNDFGITVSCDKQMLEKGVDFAKIMEEEFGEIFEWNGFKLDSIENANKGRAVLHDFFKTGAKVYLDYKDNEVLESKKRVVPGVDFAPVSIVGQSQVAFLDGKVTIDNVNAGLKDTRMLEANENYVLKVALAKKDGDGFSSTDVVALSGGSVAPITYEKGELSISAGGEYALPLNLSEGEYSLVAYVATAKDGIRVSEMTAITASSQSGEGNEVPSEAMQVILSQNNGQFIVNYAVKLIKQVEITENKESYTYGDIERILSTYVLSYGYPVEGEKVQTFEGTPLNGDEVLTSGSYKIKCYLPTKDGLSEAYVYCTLG